MFKVNEKGETEAYITVNSQMFDKNYELNGFVYPVTSCYPSLENAIDAVFKHKNECFYIFKIVLKDLPDQKFLKMIIRSLDSFCPLYKNEIGLKTFGVNLIDVLDSDEWDYYVINSQAKYHYLVEGILADSSEVLMVRLVQDEIELELYPNPSVNGVRFGFKDITMRNCDDLYVCKV